MGTVLKNLGFKDFNSQPHKEADHCTWLQVSQHEYFNSQPHKEADNNTALT